MLRAWSRYASLLDLRPRNDTKSYGLGDRMPTLNFLSPEEVESIHQASLRMLAETGILLTEPESRELLISAGAAARGTRVLLPPELVEKCVTQAGKRVSLRGRSGMTKTLGGGTLYFHNLGGAPNIYDPASGTRRHTTVQDVRDSTRLLDALENCHTITPFCTPTDVPGGVMSLAMYRHALPHTLKQVHGPGIQFAAEVRYSVKMAEVIGKPEELLTLSLSPVSPLTFPDHEAQAIVEIARQGITFSPLPCPMAGTTAPMSIAGAVAQQNAEVLAALVLAQLVRPGLPIIYCGRLAMMEPRTGLSVWGGAETGIASAATVQVGHRYGLPVNVYGFSTNAHSLEIQDGFERGLNALIPALAGADELSGIGEMEAGVMGSYAQMVADNEFAAGILRVRKGIAADADALAVEVVASVMESTRNFLGQKHTLKYLRAGEVLVTKLAERSSWETWEAGGRQGLAERAQAEAERILREHRVEPLEAAQERELDAIMAAAERELVK
ncbi:MAG: trimethylamine methyltransferase family protein [Anaerolineales bacterium]|nr:trimethylamine methyltransferase family protein [Anaerolineales bacterium]